ncbi:MAG: Ig-like domain repeat protein [Spirochaetales bacterium]|nr:Ig-like domain repeat protein [Spirochaetales bacterium]
MKKTLKSLLAKTLVLITIFTFTLSGCSESLFVPIVEEMDENNTVFSSGISLIESSGLYSESYDGTLKYYSNDSDGLIELTITSDDSSQNWTEYTLWEGDASSDKPENPTYSSLSFDGTTADVSYTLSDTSEGSTELNIQLKNSDGEESDTATVWVELDFTAPDYSLTVNGTTGSLIVASTDLTLQFIASDYDDFYQMKIWRDDESESAISYETFSASTSESIEAEESTSYYFSTLVMDKAGNISEQVDTSTITYSTSTPTFTFTIDDTDESATTTQSSTITIYTDVTYLPSSTETVYIAIWDDTESEPDSDDYEILYTDTSYHTLSSDEGDYIISVRIRQGSSNYSSEMTQSIRYDATSPSISSFTINGSATPDITNNGSLTLAVSTSDNLASTSEMEIKIWSGDEGDEPEDAEYEDLDSFSQPEVTEDGTYTYWVRVRDNSGNESTATSCEIEFDGTAPVISSFSCDDGTLVDMTDVSFTLETDSDVTAYKIWEGDEADETDDSEYVSWTYGSSIDYKLTATDDSYNINIRVKDEAGNESTDYTTETVTYDGLVPTVSFELNSGDSETNSSTVTLTFTVPGDVTGYKVWETSIPGSFTDFSSDELSDGSMDYTLTSYSDGSSSTVYMMVQDEAGNPSSTASQSIGYDVSLADPTLTIDQGTVTAESTVDLTLSADSDVTGMKVWLSGDSEPSDYSTYASTVEDFTLFSTTPSDNTSYTIYLVVEDDAGNNTSSSPVAATVTYDSAAPTIELSSSINYTSDILTASTTITTDSGDVDGVKFWLTSDSGTITEDESTTNWDESETGSTITPSYTWDLTTEDTYTVHVKARNSAGLTSTVTESIIFDETAPDVSTATISVDGNTSEFWTLNDTVSLELSDQSDDIGIYEMKIWYEGEESSEATADWESYNDDDADGTVTVSNFSLGDSDGSYTIHVLFRDETENESDEITSTTINLDQTAPDVNLRIDGSAVDSYATNSDSFTLDTNWTDTSETYTFQYWIDGDTDIADYAEFTSGWEWPDIAGEINDTEGSYIFYVNIQDQAGNVGQDMLTVTYDTTAPAISSFSIDEGEYTNSTSVNLTYSLSSDESDLEVRFSNDGSSWSDWEEATGSSEWTLSDDNEEKTVYMQVHDDAGNGDIVSIQSSDTIIYDSVAPTLDSFTITEDVDAQTGYWGSETLTVNFEHTPTVTSGETDETLYIVFWDDSTSEPEWSETSTNYTYSVSTSQSETATYTLTSTSDTYEVYCKVYDSAGNFSSTSSETVNLDLDIPTLNEFTITTESETNDPVISAEITQTDSFGAWGYKVWSSEDSGEPDVYTEFTTDYTFSYNLGTNEGEEIDYTVYVMICDNVGNESETLSQTVTIDRKGPENPTFFGIYDDETLETIVSYYLSGVGTVINLDTVDGNLYITFTSGDSSAETLKLWYTGQTEEDVTEQTIISSGYYTLTLPSTGTYDISLVIYDEFDNPSDVLTCEVTY